MTSPKPYGLHVISGELTERDIDRITSVIHRFLTFKEASQLDNLKQTYDLPDGGYFIVQDMGGVFRVIADKQQPEKFIFNNDGLVKPYIPMFFSGVVEKSWVREDENVEIKVTEQCRRRLAMQLDQDIPKTLRLKRFRIEQSPKFPEFVQQFESKLMRTQYHVQNPGWYSGTMAKLHQFIGGYGIQDFNQLPEDPIERVQMSLPNELLISLWDKYKDVRLPGYSGVPPLTGEFQYDYKYAKTHAVAFDVENKPWLIMVRDKVWAMPLPVVPLTADPEFHQHLEELGDTELLKIIETFGAFPTGESFPDRDEDLLRWVRAGVVIEICDTGDFFSHISFFRGCGWSFNNRGHSAYNTGYKYNSSGIAECTTFKLSLNLGASRFHYGIGQVTANDGELRSDDQNRLASYLSKVITGLDPQSELGKSIRFKFRYIAKTEILSRASAVIDIETEVNYWDQYVCNPIALHTGKVIKLYKGNLYHHAKPPGQPQIMFPEPMLGFCVSFDFGPTIAGAKANCDTIMYAYFDDDVLKVVKYFYNMADFTRRVDTDYESVMTVGSWYKTETSGKTSIAGNFYLTDIDDRDEVSPSITHTTIKGEDKGYDSKPFFSFDYPLSSQGSMWRNRYFTHLTKSETIYNKEIKLGVLVPMMNRNTVVHANQTRSDSKLYHESLQRMSVQDPYTYRYWTYDFAFAHISPPIKWKGSPYPKDGSPVWVETESYAPNAVSDFADNGPWIPSLPADYTWLVHPNQNQWNLNGGGGAPKVNTYTINTTEPAEVTGNLKWVINDKVVTLSKNVPHPRHFLPSPDDYGATFVMTSSKVFLGEVEYTNIDLTNDAGLWKYTGYSNLVNHTRAYHFIGVINE